MDFIHAGQSVRQRSDLSREFPVRLQEMVRPGAGRRYAARRAARPPQNTDLPTESSSLGRIVA